MRVGESQAGHYEKYSVTEMHSKSKTESQATGNLWINPAGMH